MHDIKAQKHKNTKDKSTQKHRSKNIYKKCIRRTEIRDKMIYSGTGREKMYCVILQRVLQQEIKNI